MKKEKKYLKPEAEVIKLPEIDTGSIIDTSVPDLPNDLEEEE